MNTSKYTGHTIYIHDQYGNDLEKTILLDYQPDYMIITVKGAIQADTDFSSSLLRAKIMRVKPIDSTSAEYGCEFIERGLPSESSIAEDCLEERIGYVEIKESAHELLEKITVSGSVSMDDTSCVSVQISEKLETLVPSVIFQCINIPRPIDEYLHRHSVNVALLNGLIGKWLGLCGADIDWLVLAGQQFSDLDFRLVQLFTEHMPEEFVGKSFFLSDGSIGTIKYMVPNDPEYPLVDVNGEIKKTGKHLFCERMIYEK